ncbi:hypothetical protein PHMEG_00022731 [Phytophthora megakarya]|uniref:Transmembrane protein n=1 Tax=Phytophthora megakarya TaxID=4795 RepID=A0A225VI05_9STRA|nr:hypothetical protein PHMEG_00022731 [Phytophthora megakarya]
MHLFTALCVIGGWTTTTPYRAVAWTFVCEVWRVLCLNCSMAAEIVAKYQEVVQDQTIQQIRGWAYVGALGGAALSVPTLVLSANEERYGRYGRMHCARWNAWRETLYEYLPDLIADTWCSAKLYCCAWKEATGATLRRVYAALRATGWFGMLLLSLFLHVPMMLYDVLEYLCCGGMGVAVTLGVLNLLNLLFEWCCYGMHFSIGVLVVGVLTHAWRHGSVEGQLEGTASRMVLRNALVVSGFPVRVTCWRECSVGE